MQLQAATEEQQLFGMGIKIIEGRNSLAGIGSMMMMSPNDFKLEAADIGVDLGSRFAKSLGFYDDVPFSGDDHGDVSALGDLREMSLDD